MYRADPAPSGSGGVVTTLVYHYTRGMDHEVRITLRLPADLHSQLVARAKAARRSLNAEIVHQLEVGIDVNPPGGELATPGPKR